MENLQKSNNVETGKRSIQLKKVGFFLCFLLPFIWAVYDSGPNIIFQIDKIEGEAVIIRADNQLVKFRYYHKFKDKEFELGYKLGNIKKVEELKSKNNWKILYSKNFPKRVSIVGIDSPPSALPSLIFILIFALPLIFFKNFTFHPPSA